MLVVFRIRRAFEGRAAEQSETMQFSSDGYLGGVFHFGDVMN